MDVMHPRCAGVDISKRDAKACVRVQGRGKRRTSSTVTTWGVTQFPTAGHLCSWAGTAPGSNESAGRVKSTKTRPGNRYPKGALGVAALSASRSKGTYFSAKDKRIAYRRGPMKAIVAVEHSMLVAAWNMLTDGAFYRDPGADYFTHHVPAKTKARAIEQLQALGYRVTLQPLADTA